MASITTSVPHPERRATRQRVLPLILAAGHCVRLSTASHGNRSCVQVSQLTDHVPLRVLLGSSTTILETFQNNWSSSVFKNCAAYGAASSRFALEVSPRPPRILALAARACIPIPRQHRAPRVARVPALCRATPEPPSRPQSHSRQPPSPATHTASFLAGARARSTQSQNHIVRSRSATSGAPTRSP